MRWSIIVASVGLVFSLAWRVDSATSPARTLTVEEAWRVYGGANQKCSTFLGRCYSPNDDCLIYSGQVCDLDVVYFPGNSTGETCETSEDPDDNCVENGEPRSCMLYCNCTTIYDEFSVPIGCEYDPGESVCEWDSVTSGWDATGDECP